MDRKPITAMALIDLRKAFDSLCHLSLLNKLTKEPITWLTRLETLNKALLWLLSYLTNRQQCMGIATSLSEPLTLTHCVPQGSILGFQKSSSHVTVNPMWMTRKYLSFSTKGLDSYSYLRLVAEDLHHVSEWCCANHLLVNPDKTKLLLFGVRQIVSKMPWVLWTCVVTSLLPFINLQQYNVASITEHLKLGIISLLLLGTRAQFHSSRRVSKEKWSLAGFSDLLNSMWLSYL